MSRQERTGALLKKLRTEKKESQEELGIAVGVSKMAVSLYEAGARTPSDDVKIKIARHFNKPVGEIFFAEKVS